MPSAGDLVIYGIGAAEGHVSFIAEMGAHAGPSPEELHTFIIHSANITLPAPIVHPVQLYDHFIRYQEALGHDSPSPGTKRRRRGGSLRGRVPGDDVLSEKSPTRKHPMAVRWIKDVDAAEQDSQRAQREGGG